MKIDDANLSFDKLRTIGTPFMVSLSNHARLVRCLGTCIVLLAVFLSAAPLYAQVRMLTLEEALAIAAEKNRDIEKARAYIAWAQGKYVEERAAAFPQLTASASLGWDQDESQKIYSPMQTARTERRVAQIGLTQPLFTWGQVSAAIRAAKVGLSPPMSSSASTGRLPGAMSPPLSTMFSLPGNSTPLPSTALSRSNATGRRPDESFRLVWRPITTSWRRRCQWKTPAPKQSGW
jgi:hypothetical protein